MQRHEQDASGVLTMPIGLMRLFSFGNCPSLCAAKRNQSFSLSARCPLVRLGQLPRVFGPFLQCGMRYVSWFTTIVTTTVMIKLNIKPANSFKTNWPYNSGCVYILLWVTLYPSCSHPINEQNNWLFGRSPTHSLDYESWLISHYHEPFSTTIINHQYHYEFIDSPWTNHIHTSLTIVSHCDDQ